MPIGGLKLINLKKNKPMKKLLLLIPIILLLSGCGMKNDESVFMDLSEKETVDKIISCSGVYLREKVFIGIEEVNVGAYVKKTGIKETLHFTGLTTDSEECSSLLKLSNGNLELSESYKIIPIETRCVAIQDKKIVETKKLDSYHKGKFICYLEYFK